MPRRARAFVGALLFVVIAGPLMSDAKADPADSLRSDNTMTVLWRKDVGRSVAVSPILDGDRLFVAPTDGRLFALAKESGKKIWSRRVREGIEAAVLVSARSGEISKGPLVLGLGTGEVRALDPIEGETLWKVNVRSPVVSLLCDERRLFVLARDGSLRAIAPEDGSALWKHEGLGHDPPAPLLDGSRVIAVARGDSAFAWDAESGERVWAVAAPGWHHAPPVLHEGKVIVTATDGSCLSLSSENGVPSDRRSGLPFLLEAPLSSSSFLITTSSGGEVFGFAEDGRRWSRDLGRSIGARPVRMDRLVLLGTRDGTLFALRADRGDIAWSLHLHGGFRVPPIAVDRLLILATDEGELYVYAREG